MILILQITRFWFSLRSREFAFLLSAFQIPKDSKNITFWLNFAKFLALYLLVFQIFKEFRVFGSKFLSF